MRIQYPLHRMRDVQHLKRGASNPLEGGKRAKRRCSQSSLLVAVQVLLPPVDASSSIWPKKKHPACKPQGLDTARPLASSWRQRTCTGLNIGPGARPRAEPRNTLAAEGPVASQSQARGASLRPLRGRPGVTRGGELGGLVALGACQGRGAQNGTVRQTGPRTERTWQRL